MQEILSLVLGQLRNIWRFRWIALGIAWIIAIVGWLYVYSLPDQYSSSARVHIDTKSAIDPLLHGMAVMPNADQQVSLLIRTVLSRPHLRDIARATGLDLRATTPEQEQALIQGLQNRLTLSNSGGDANLYTITYTSSKPTLAQSVVQQVMSIMTTMNLSNSNGGDTTQAVAFLAHEVDKYKQKLNETEQQLSTFKKSHAQMMPGANDYVTQVQRIHAKIGSIQDQLAAARNRKANIAANMGSGGSSVPPAQSQQVQRLDDQINGAQQKLSQLLTRYTPRHPDVIDTKHRIANLKQRRSEMLARLSAHPEEIQAPAAASSGGGRAARLSQAKIQISALESSLQRKEQQLQELQDNADSMNDAQAQLAQLSRNYAVTRDQYQQLLSRLYSARLSTDVQNSSEALQFRVIDPPEVPAEPSGPKRMILMAMALIGALVAGLAFAWFLAQLRPVFSSRRDLTDATGVPVIGSVSLALSPAQRANRRRSMLVFFVCCASLPIGFAVALALVPIGVHWVPNIVSGQVL
ncbi:XrtA system polysaccharide chain length determinant [Salinisphaera sp.]|uniref:XrtA system polysaccharide chain length determinant n=1 Tax=Salinisphaera sp. TaxID=1914330 RepID=UPI002D7928F5|nr:XrtA system polysaccharide chain length determinant [Salinisphaera sp.]HET7314051.1 XrtA system polysaccharide chain length determinant [Salinisphaera sp.]